MAEITNPTCATCRFWDLTDAKDRGDDYGACRRMPPVMSVLYSQRMDEELESDGDAEDARIAVFPVTTLEDWCGEWQPRPTTNAKGT